MPHSIEVYVTPKLVLLNPFELCVCEALPTCNTVDVYESIVHTGEVGPIRYQGE